MAKKTIIDEDLVRQAIGNTPSILDADPPPFDERIIKTVEVPAETPQSGERRKRMAVPDFEQTFMSLVDIRFRAAIYVSAETKHKISEVVKKNREGRNDRDVLCGKHPPTSPRNL